MPSLIILLIFLGIKLFKDHSRNILQNLILYIYGTKKEKCSLLYVHFIFGSATAIYKCSYSILLIFFVYSYYESC